MDYIKNLQICIDLGLMPTENKYLIFNYIEHISSTNPKFLKHVSKEHITYESAKKCILRNPKCFKYIPKEHLTYELVKDVLSTNPKYFKYIAKEYVTYKLVKNLILDDVKCFEYVPEKYLTNKLVNLAIEKHPFNLQHVPKYFRSYDLYKKALLLDHRCLHYIPDQNDEFHNIYLDNCGNKINIYIIKNPSYDICERIVKQWPLESISINNLSSSLRQLAIQTNPHVITLLSNATVDEIEMAASIDSKYEIFSPNIPDNVLDDLVADNIKWLYNNVEQFCDIVVDDVFERILLSASKINILFFWEYSEIPVESCLKIIEIYPELKKYLNSFIEISRLGDCDFNMFSNIYDKWKKDNKELFATCSKKFRLK